MAMLRAQAIAVVARGIGRPAEAAVVVTAVAAAAAVAAGAAEVAADIARVMEPAWVRAETLRRTCWWYL
jgi:hypothetical protein